MLVIDFLVWWYGAGWKRLAIGIANSIDRTGRAFSVGTLLKTLFAPWRRVITPPGRSLADHFAAWRDNTVGRFIGFGVRSVVLITAAVAVIFIAAGGVLLFIAWPFLPLGLVACVYLGVRG